MKTRVAGVLAASATAVAMMGAPAFAGTGGGGGGPTTSGNGSLLSGNQIIAPISIAIDACGNAIAILGIAHADCQGGAFVSGPLLGW
jgi:hypothetical protein